MLCEHVYEHTYVYAWVYVYVSFILVLRRREWQEVLTREKHAGAKIVGLSWQRDFGKFDKYTIDLARMMQKNVRLSASRQSGALWMHLGSTVQ